MPRFYIVHNFSNVLNSSFYNTWKIYLKRHVLHQGDLNSYQMIFQVCACVHRPRSSPSSSLPHQQSPSTNTTNSPASSHGNPDPTCSSPSEVTTGTTETSTVLPLRTRTTPIHGGNHSQCYPTGRSSRRVRSTIY